MIIVLFVPGLFPKATEYKTFNRVSNPYECDIGGNNGLTFLLDIAVVLD